MSLREDAVETDGKCGRYDELSEDWFSDNESICSSVSDASTLPSHVVVKRQSYPHWEEGVLKDEVVLQTHGRQDEKLCQQHELKSNGPESVPRSHTYATESSSLSAPITGERINPQLYGQSPNDPSPFTSSVPPHLPPATQFPPLDPRAELLKPTRETREITTFSFARLQMLVDDSAERKSTLSILAGVHNQVQGPLRNPSLWSLPSGSGPNDNGANGTRAFTPSSQSVEDVRDDLTVDNWPIMKDEQLTALRSIELAFGDSFSPGASSASSNSGNKTPDHNSNVNGTNEGVIQQRFDCTCGHSKHYVRPFVDDDDDGDRGTTWTCSELGGEEDNTDDYGNRVRDIIREDTVSAIESYAASESSRRANASSASLNSTSNSRTSSEFYLSPNFPDSDHANNYFPEATPVLGNGQREDSTDEERDIHRVHFPAQSFRTPSNSGFRNFLDAARRRMSSISGTSRPAGGKKSSQRERRKTLATSTELETHNHMTVDGLPAGSNGDTPRFFADLGRSRTLRPLDVTASTCKSEVPLVEDSSGSEQRSQALVSSTRGNGERSRNKRNFWRRFSLQLGHNSKDDENSEATPSSDVPPVSLQTSPPSGSDVRSPSLPEETRPRASSGSVLFRSFRLAGPRSPRPDGRRGAERN
ncbi:uncharacterized protein FOMMEDRAFT_145658 [Fomitiporia mediterranea MF3/22]|uniref:uncharacterized protein n=1 Tax=Fomitiporia mediterranea (strain MF3/22) TaxID=694068 RepID=UPI0004409B52|nr:uncharacterized protein FOMMEDRAFT_145658 [Fomitiporia mediterranea MF3/22]EJD04988.1 hypothetical protein FOMMEDRAFT_145658 [Fomitiporia mediterranea MF3/22]